jgi:hypothetical protein
MPLVGLALRRLMKRDGMTLPPYLEQVAAETRDPAFVTVTRRRELTRLRTRRWRARRAA